ncbi:MAG: tetratricopeptide repeat protein [Cyclobacteriaceae bacterium]
MKYSDIKTAGLLFLTFIVSQQMLSQNIKIDSVSHLLVSHNRQDTAKVNLLIAKATLYKDVAIDSTLFYATQGEQLARNLKFPLGEARSILLISQYYREKRQYLKAEEFTDKALTIFVRQEDTDGMIGCYENLGEIAFDQFQFDKAALYYQKVAAIHEADNHSKKLVDTWIAIAKIYRYKQDFPKAKSLLNQILVLAKTIDYQRATVLALNSLGSINSATNNYPEAIDNFNRALIMAEANEEVKIIPVLLHNIAAVYLRQGSLEKSLDYLNKAYLGYEKNKDIKNIINCLNDLGSLYKTREDYQIALQYYKSALVIAGEERLTYIVATLYNNIGHLNFTLKKYDESINYLNKGLEAAIVTKSKERMYYSHLGLGKVYYEMKDYDVALKNALKGLELIEEVHQINHRNEVHELLANIYSEKGDFQKAYDNQVLFKTFTDSAFNLEAAKKIAQLELEYKYREEKLSAKLKEERLITENEKTMESLVLVKNQKLWMIIGILVLMLVLVFVIMNHHVKNLRLKTKNALTEQKLLRSQMTPHFMFNSLSVLQGIILNKEYMKSLDYIAKFSSLLRLSLDNSRTTLVKLEKEILAIEKYLIVQNIARKLPFHYEISTNDLPNLPDLLIPPMLIQPFVENAIKHGFRELKDDQEIKLVFTYAHNQLICSIIDNGIGVEAHKKMFSSSDPSISTDLIRERLKILSKEFNVKSGITVKDRKDVNENGTIVLINLPYKTQIDDESIDSRG